MSEISVSLESLGRSKRATLRSINSIRSAVNKTLAENPSEHIAHQASALLKTWKPLLDELNDTTNQIIENTDFTGKTDAQVATIEMQLSKELEQIRLEFSFADGKVSEMFARLAKPLVSRSSLNSSILDEAPTHIKLPDITVPKFDGKFENFTEWHALFLATIDKHPGLSSAKKLYYLKQAMIGDAKYLLKDCNFEEGSYEQALQHVEQRYNNKRIIIAKHFADLVDFPQITVGSLRESLDKINATIRGLKVCKIDVAKMSPLITFLAVRKLPEKLRIDWEHSNHDYSTYPSFEPLDEFLRNRCFSYESIYTDAGSNSTKKSPAVASDKPKSKSSLATINKSSVPSSSSKCVSCMGDHYISACPKFIEKSVSDRFNFAKEKYLCLNCLRLRHSASECRSSKCRKCGKPHHTLLHREIISTSGSPSTPDSSLSVTGSPVVSTPKASLATVKPDNRFVLLPSAVVKVVLGSKTVLARLLLDLCAQADLVTESFVKRNKLRSQYHHSLIQGTTPGDLTINSIVQLKIQSRFTDYQLNVVADVVGRIPYEIPKNALQFLAESDLNLPLADSDLDWPTVDILLGNTHANRILLGTKRYINDLCLEESRFGLVVSGPLGKPALVDVRCCHLTTTVRDVLSKFWEVEEVESPKVSHTDFELCESHFNSTYTRLADGRFQIRLPFKSATSSLADTYSQARASLLRSEIKLDPETRRLYVEFMHQYRLLGHMEPISFKEARFFIPHLAVKKPDSTTTKLRVVFNASAKNTSGISLNEALLNGPALQPVLFDNILHFRTYRIAFSADIGMMYRQTQVHPDDRPYQSILWRDSSTDVIQAYQLTTVTYGTTPAAYLATKCLQVLAQDVQSQHPEIAHAISHEFYMDDLLSGAHCVESAVKKRNLIHATLAEAQLPLRKYVSNSSEFLSSLDPSLVESLTPVAFSSSGTTKVLGLRWDPTSDCFFVNVKLVDISNVTLTKRAVSSLIGQVFDPLGFVAPVIIRSKIILQDLWREGKDWDDPISTELDAEFRNYYAELNTLSSFVVPRPYFCDEACKIDLVGFCDASNRAYGSVIYLRVHGHSSIKPVLVCAKTRVAPVKAITIPRLELLGAVLLSQLINRVRNILKNRISEVFAFSDSTIVLAWLKGPASKYQTFIRNRVELITSNIDFSRWFYVKSKENPADLISRGICVKALVDNKFWLHGPEWLTTKSSFDNSVLLPEQPPETRIVKSCNALVNEFIYTEDLLSRYSNFEKLIRIVSHIYNFTYKCNISSNCNYSVDNFVYARYAICRMSQLCFFRQEFRMLQAGQSVSSKSPLLSLDVFLDTHHIIRVGGRLRNSKLSFDAKHPIVLHKRSILASLLIRYIHEKYYHATRAFTLSHLQSRYWIVGGAPQLVKKVLYQCVWCARTKGDTLKQLMGQLPTERTTVSRPFSTTGIDFAGPFTVRCTKHRSVKHLKYYAAFFVCFVTRAVHIETVSDLSTEMFIEALQRFCARRGIPHTIWTDNGTNFVGASNVLKQYCSSQGIVWKFIPPRSPHHGGIWESAVKAGKKYLVSASRNVVLTAEQLCTVFTKIEAILNSRPLYRRHGTSDPDVIDVLTPGHFLVGSNLLEPVESNSSILSLNQRLTTQGQVIDSFWQQWRRCYLNQLQQRQKWKESSPNLVVGDVVLLKEESHPHLWPMARVIETVPDANGCTRVVVVRSKDSLFRRSIQQLVKLPIESSSTV